MNNNKQQTAVDILFFEIKRYNIGNNQYLINKEDLEKLELQAKEMEKEQIIDTFVEGMRCQNFDPNKGRAEIYYNETFNQQP